MNVFLLSFRRGLLKQYIDIITHEYDYILIDTTPSLGLMTVNALAAANSVLIPIQAQYLSLKGLEQLLQTIVRIKKQINPSLVIEGILITIADTRTNYSKDIITLLEKTYTGKIKIFNDNIPQSIKASEISAKGVSIYIHDPNGKAALAYEALTKEVLSVE